MADGYARLTGRPGVCFVITGPGVTNIDHRDGAGLCRFVPMLVISGVNATSHARQGLGNLHELPDQRGMVGRRGVRPYAASAEDLPAVLARAFALFRGPAGPVHIEIPLDVMAATVADKPRPSRRRSPRAPPAEALDEAARLLEKAERPLILAGGGASRAGPEIPVIAERLDAPVVMTANGRGLRRPAIRSRFRPAPRSRRCSS